ncbi:Mur ligase family protein [Oceanospirillaceae bacterium]|nr:Mur ligase family protein [Oceanospirillaceae bacterium]
MVEAADTIETALDISCSSSENLILDDFRRLTGPGLLWSHVGANLDVLCPTADLDEVIKVWQQQARRVLDAIGWHSEQIIDRRFEGGANLAVSAPMDQLYSAMFACQTAWHFASAQLLNQTANNFDIMINDLRNVMVREANPALITLIKVAKKHGIDVLCDDDHLSLGHGEGSQTWSVFDLPKPTEVNWHSLHDIPVALITGTNGKTTSTRLCSAIGAAAGLIAGITSTEFVRVGDDILDYGDYSGPGGARMLLRDKRLQVAFLEVARGGILRRGLPLRQAQAALVTNVAADHLGQYGVNTVEELAVAKFSVHRTLAANGVLVLNADDEYVRAEVTRTQAILCWFSLDPAHPLITQAKTKGHTCAWQEGDHLVYFDGTKAYPVVNVKDIPISMGGAADYNIRNALGALCLAKVMNIDNKAIALGLCNFKNDAKDNPGRCNEFAIKGARVFVDFAHNPHSISAVTDAMAGVPAKRRFIMISHAGDRSDQDILDATQSALALNPDFLMAAELPQYLRGRELGETLRLTHQQAIKHGLKTHQLLVAEGPAAGTKQILSQLQEGDLALLLVLSERDQVFAMLDPALTH